MDQNVSSGDSPSDRRRAHRDKVPKPARILVDGGTENGGHDYTCVIRDLSETGAKVESSPQTIAHVPDGFEIAIGKGKPRACKVVWRRQKQLGITFS